MVRGMSFPSFTELLWSVETRRSSPEGRRKEVEAERQKPARFRGFQILLESLHREPVILLQAADPCRPKHPDSP